MLGWWRSRPTSRPRIASDAMAAPASAAGGAGAGGRGAGVGAVEDAGGLGVDGVAPAGGAGLAGGVGPAQSTNETTAMLHHRVPPSARRGGAPRLCCL